MGVLHTPDFFVIRDHEAGWEEWKTEEELQHLNARNPHRYLPKPKAQGGWDCPPGAASYTASLGLYYRVRSSAEMDCVGVPAQYSAFGRLPARRSIAFAQPFVDTIQVQLNAMLAQHAPDLMGALIAQGLQRPV